MVGYWIKGRDGKSYHAENEQIVIKWIEENRIAPFTEIRKSDSDEFKKAETYPEFSQAFHSPPHFPLGSNGPSPVQPQSSIKVGLALNEGWNFFRANLFLSYSALVVWISIFIAIGLMAGFFQTFLSRMVSDSSLMRTSAQWLNFLFQMILTGPLTVGFYKFWLNMLDQQNPKFRDFFNGFEIWWPAMLSQWIKAAVMVGIILLSLPFFSISLFSKFQNLIESGQMPVMEEWLGFIIGIAVVGLLIMTVMTFFWFVEFFLADRCSLKVSRCFIASSRLALKNFGGLALLFTVVSLILLGGFLFFIIGAFLILPWIILTVVHSYRQLVPRGTTL